MHICCPAFGKSELQLLLKSSVVCRNADFDFSHVQMIAVSEQLSNWTHGVDVE